MKRGRDNEKQRLDEGNALNLAAQSKSGCPGTALCRVGCPVRWWGLLTGCLQSCGSSAGPRHRRSFPAPRSRGTAPARAFGTAELSGKQVIIESSSFI